MKLKLQGKAILFFAMLMASSFGAALVYGFREQRHDLLDMAEDKFAVIAANLGMRIYRDYEIDDWRGLQSLLEDAMRATEGVLECTVYDSTGVNVASTRTGDAGQGQVSSEIQPVLEKRSYVAEVITTADPWIIRVWAPIASGTQTGVVKGVVALDGSLALVQAGLRENVGQQLMIFIVVMAVGCFGSLMYLRRGIVGPIKRLSGAMQRVVAGEFLPSGVSKAKDEIGDLTASFDWMVGELRRSREYLEDYNRTLMQMVAAEENREELDRVISSISYALIGLDAEGRVTRWNTAAEVIFGIPTSGAVGGKLSDCGIAWDGRRVAGMLDRCRTEGGALSEDINFERIDGRKGCLALTVNPITVTMDDGKVERPGYVLLGTDKTEQKQAEDERARLAMAVEQATECIAVSDRHGTILYVNPAFERASGSGREAVVGRNLDVLFERCREMATPYDDIWTSISEGQVWRGRLVKQWQDGRSWQEDATITPVSDPAGRIVNFVAVSRDVTQEIALELQLRQSQKLEAVGSLAAGIAHEINTPIQFVGDNVRFLSESFTELITLLEQTTGLMDALAAHPEFSARLQEFAHLQESVDVGYLRDEIPRAIEQTLDGVKRVATIVRAMKDFSHPDQKQKAPADLNKALSSTLAVARNELKYVADVTTDFDPNLPQVWCHLGDLNQVFLNLLINAGHAIADVVGEAGNRKGAITITTRREGEGVRVSIADTGTGIPDAIRQRVFDPFFTTKEAGRGTGQGLAIARSVVVDKHKGRLTFDTQLGKGTTFHVYLPIGAGEAVEAV